jgi:hypothetical protein
MHFEFGVGFVEYPLDRFQGLWTEELEATCASFVMDEKLPRLRVNAAIEPGGEVRGALLIDGKAVPGFDFSDCAPVTDDVLVGELNWKGSARLLSRAGTEVQLRLRMQKAWLFAIEKL